MNEYHIDKKVRLVNEIDNAIDRLKGYKANMILRHEGDKTMLYDVAISMIAEIIKSKE